jgi:hypothetical protein
MIEININNIDETPTVNKINVGDGKIFLEYIEDTDQEDPVNDIKLSINQSWLSCDIELFRIDMFSTKDKKEQKELCNKLITALQFVERNWFD